MGISHFVATYTLVLSFGFGVKEGTHQDYYRLRPIPSDILPVSEPCGANTDPTFDPKERDFNEAKLKSKLGSHFDSFFMSITPPDNHTDISQRGDEYLRLSNGSMPLEIKSLQFDVLYGKKQTASRKLQRKMQLWLWSYAFCPVFYAWKDLGRRFWPRYVKDGSCHSERSCSVPEGMVCRPNKTTHFTILTWRCSQRDSRVKCGWINVQYPTIAECKCSCS